MKLEIELKHVPVLISDGKKIDTVNLPGLVFNYDGKELAGVRIGNYTLIIFTDNGMAVVPPAPYEQIIECVEGFLWSCAENESHRLYVKQCYAEHDTGKPRMQNYLINGSNPHLQN